MEIVNGGAAVESAAAFFRGASGKWAAEQFIAGLQRGEEPSTAQLRAAGTLRKDEWITFDQVLVEEATIRLRAVADLRAAGLVRNGGGLGKTVYEYEKVSDMEPAQTSMDGLTRTENDRVEFLLAQLPMPITHKDFNINLRTLLASRERGESLDTTQIRVAGRLIAEQVESLLINGGPTFAGLPIYGYRTHPDRNIVPFGTNGNWSQVAKTGENMLDDVLSMKAALEGDRMFGPYRLYIPSAYSTVIEEDFKANSDKSIRQRLMEVEGLQAITVVDQMPANNMIMVQLTPDVVTLIEGAPLQTVQWDIAGGFQINFKGMTIQVPLIRSDYDNRSGVAHMS